MVNALIRLLDHTLNMLMKFLAVIALSPIFSVPGVILAGFGIYVGNMYMKAQLPVKREMSNAKAPVLGHFGAAIAGLGRTYRLFIYFGLRCLQFPSGLMVPKKHSARNPSAELTITQEPP